MGDRPFPGGLKIKGRPMSQLTLMPIITSRAEEIEREAAALPSMSQRPGVCGGRTCVDGTRVLMDYLVEMWLVGEMEDVIEERDRGITRAYFDAAILYASKHPEEMDWRADSAHDVQVDPSPINARALGDLP